MLLRQYGSLGAVISAFALLLQLSTEQALAQDRRQECSARYKSAKADGTLGDVNWPKFFSRCMAELKTEAEASAKPAAPAPEPVNPLKPTPAAPAQPAAIETAPPATSAAEAPAPATPPAPPAPAAAPAPPEPAPVAPTATAAPPPAVQAVSPAPREPVFPTAIAPAYAKEKAHIARQKTCLDQYNANKATDSNGGLKWIQKGGGYLGACNKRLKGAS